MNSIQELIQDKSVLKLGPEEAKKIKGGSAPNDTYDSTSRDAIEHEIDQLGV